MTLSVKIPENELQFDFIRSSGPGGQNVNKVATAVQLRFNVLKSDSLPGEIKRRLVRLAGNRMTRSGELVIDSRRYRSQEKNRKEAKLRLFRLIEEAYRKPKSRRKTRPGLAAKQRRLDQKRKRGQIKKLRRSLNKHKISD